MRILIVEDERPIAKYVQRLCQDILGAKINSIELLYTLDQAATYLFQHQIDLCLLDLNLNGRNGYELLKMAVSGSFHTIIISAYTDQAVEAFQYGVLDFIPKPFDEARLRQAFDRYFNRTKRDANSTEYLTVRQRTQYKVISIDDVIYFKAAGIYVDAYLKDGKVEILDKTMDRLGQILPERFLRIHRSCYVDLNHINTFGHVGGGVYQVLTKNGASLPLSRSKYKELQQLFHA